MINSLLEILHSVGQLVQKYEIKVFKIIWLLLPAALANMAPIFARFIFPNWNTPIDFGLKFHKNRIFGDHKTYRGFFAAVMTGFIVFIVQQVLYWKIPWLRFFKIVDYDVTSPFFGAWLGFCAITGDLIKSFFKRRIQIRPGEPWITLTFPHGLEELYLPGLI